MDKPNIEKIYRCMCRMEGILLTAFDDEDKSVDLSMWAYGKTMFPWTFWERLRWCWYVLKKGRPYTDCVILDYPTARQLAEDILKGTE